MKETVLLICDDNSILSQMAEAVFRRYGWSTFTVYSAGIEPRPVHIYTLQVMEEIGYDLYNVRAKSLFDLNHLEYVDYLITLSDYVNDHFSFNEENIGLHLHWSIRNPLVDPGQLWSDILPPQLTWPDGWQQSEGFLSATIQQTRPLTQMPLNEYQPGDIKEIRKRFRKVRDEIEVQVMNWLEEKGLGPIWWCR